jgi:hypothetical protein
MMTVYLDSELFLYGSGTERHLSFLTHLGLTLQYNMTCRLGILQLEHAETVPADAPDLITGM